MSISCGYLCFGNQYQFHIELFKEKQYQIIGEAHIFWSRGPTLELDSITSCVEQTSFSVLIYTSVK